MNNIKKTLIETLTRKFFDNNGIMYIIEHFGNDAGIILGYSNNKNKAINDANYFDEQLTKNEQNEIITIVTGYSIQDIDFDKIMEYINNLEDINLLEYQDIKLLDLADGIFNYEVERYEDEECD